MGNSLGNLRPAAHKQLVFLQLPIQNTAPINVSCGKETSALLQIRLKSHIYKSGHQLEA